MRRIFVWLTFLFLGVPCALSQIGPKTQLTGTLNNPDGTGFNGTLYLSFPQAAAVLSTNNCGGPVQIVPNETLNINISNGTMVSYTTMGLTSLRIGAPKVYGGDCTIPTGLLYNASLKDKAGNTVFTTQWLVQGVIQDIGTLYETPAVVPNGSVTLVTGYGQPTGQCNAYTFYEQLDATAGNNLWYCLAGGWVTSSSNNASLAINSTINGTQSYPNAVLFSQNSKLTADLAFAYNQTLKTLSVQNIAATNLNNGGSANNVCITTQTGANCDVVFNGTTHVASFQLSPMMPGIILQDQYDGHGYQMTLYNRTPQFVQVY